MTWKILWLILLCAVTGICGCMGGSKTAKTIPPTPRTVRPTPRTVPPTTKTVLLTTTTVPSTTKADTPVVEPVITTVAAPANVDSAAGEGGRSRGSRRRGQGRSQSNLSKNELWQLTEELLSLDTGINQPTIRQQGKTSAQSTRDSANNPLFESVPSSAFNKDTVRLMKQLLDNYYPDVGRTEERSASEQTEENRFLDALMETPLMQRLERFLQEKNLISHGLRQKLEDIWFTLYSRKGGKLGSSGFEHVFIGELKGGKVSGFHNWLNFRKEELDGDLNYMGYMRIVDLNGKGKIIKLRFDWLHNSKPVGSIFIGTTPELEIGLYTLCFLARPNSGCSVKLAGKKFGIQTWTYSSSGKTVIGSAYPNI